VAGRPLKKRVQQLGRSVGVDVRRWIPEDAMQTHEHRRQLILAAQGITLILDVGANEGQYGQWLRESGYTGRIASFEPLSAPFARLSALAADDDAWTCVQTALGPDAGMASMNVAANREMSSSMLDWGERAASEFVGTEEVEQTTLDEAARTLMRDDDEVALKLDVQGYEPEVMRGGGETLARARVLEVELALQPMYEGQLGYREMLDRLTAEGFELVAVDPGYTDWETGVTYEIDAIFVRR
jgi:FkbM family methyltransferase